MVTNGKHDRNGAPTWQIVTVFLGTLALFWAVVIASEWIRPHTAVNDKSEMTAGTASAGMFSPPPDTAIPSGPQGDAIRRGEAIFRKTQIYARRYAGSGLNCTNCHLDGGRKADASPMWAAWVRYPAWRAKNGKINTMEDRIRGCFIYSMNAQASPAGTPPPPGDDIYRDLETYFAWLATGAPTGADMKGRGYPKLTKVEYDPARGAKVFEEQCSSCHGANGQGTPDPKGGYLYPPLWGDHSFNWGAGMAKVANAAGFVKANMPFGMGNSLTDQQAWDVAAFLDSHERPADPRQKGMSVAETRSKFHASGDYYGQTIGGDLLGDGTP